MKINASELILDEQTAQILDTVDLQTVIDPYINVIGDKYYRRDAMRDTIRRHFGVTSARGIGVEEDTDAETALGALLLYLYDTQKSDLSHIRNLSVYTVGEHMSLDKATIKNLVCSKILEYLNLTSHPVKKKKKSQLPLKCVFCGKLGK